MRARFHVRGRMLGFFREGTHQLCDPAGTGQLLPETNELVRDLAERVRSGGLDGVTEDRAGREHPRLRARSALRARPAGYAHGARGHRDAADDGGRQRVVRGAGRRADGRRGRDRRACWTAWCYRLRAPARRPQPTRKVRPTSPLRRIARSRCSSSTTRRRSSRATATCWHRSRRASCRSCRTGPSSISTPGLACSRPRSRRPAGRRSSRWKATGRAADLRANASPFGRRARRRSRCRSGALPCPAHPVRREATIVIDPPRTGMSKEASAAVAAQAASPAGLRVVRRRHVRARRPPAGGCRLPPRAPGRVRPVPEHRARRKRSRCFERSRRGRIRDLGSAS